MERDIISRMKEAHEVILIMSADREYTLFAINGVYTTKARILKRYDIPKRLYALFIFLGSYDAAISGSTRS